MQGFYLRNWNRVLFLTLLIGLGAAILPSAQPVAAATGGGCSGLAVDVWASAKACISAPAYGVGRPDGYVTLAYSHPNCTIHIFGVRIGDRRIMSRRWYPCPKGPIFNRRYAGNDFNAYEGLYASVVIIEGSLAQPYSPRLQLP